MKRLEDHLETTTVILAGYEAQMQSLWSVNPGFRSRIPETNWIRFPDYTVDELLEIFMRMCARSSLEVAVPFATGCGDSSKRRCCAGGSATRGECETWSSRCGSDEPR